VTDRRKWTIVDVDRFAHTAAIGCPECGKTTRIGPRHIARILDGTLVSGPADCGHLLNLPDDVDGDLSM